MKNAKKKKKLHRTSRRLRSESPLQESESQIQENEVSSDSRSVYLAKLPFKANEQQIEELLSQHGTCEGVNIIRDPHTNESRGFAFGRMSSHDEAQKVVEALNGSRLENNDIVAQIVNTLQRNFM